MKNVVFVLVFIGAAIGGYYLVGSLTGGKPKEYERTMQGTLVHVDVAARQATLEYTDPSDGSAQEATGAVPEDCAIFLNGKPVGLADLKRGDTVEVRGKLVRKQGDTSGQKSYDITALSIEATRAEADSE